MGYRRKARELGLQALYYMDMNGSINEEALALFAGIHPPDEKVAPYFSRLVEGVMDHREIIDRTIHQHSEHWKVSRMACVDRNILRIAVFELLWCEDVPPKVSINEAIDIGKRFGTDDSGAFINGILDSIRNAMDKNELIIPDNSVRTMKPIENKEAGYDR